MSVVTQRRRIWLLLRFVMHPAQSMDIGHGPFPVAAVFLIIALVIWYSILYRRTGRPLPPGPKRLPIIGNLFNMPTTIPSAEKYHELTQKYGTCWYSQPDSLDTEASSTGDIVYLSVLGRRMVILGSYEAASELLDKRSAIYSDRPQPVMTDL